MDVLVNGAPVYAHTGGRPVDPAGPVTVLLHGAGMDHTVWVHQSRYLAHRGQGVLAVDLPGHGRSGGTALDSIDALADWTVAFLDAVGIGTAVLAGHSMGALTALDTAARHPARVAGLMLLGVAERMPVHPDLLAAARADDPQAAALIAGWGFGPAGHVGGQPAPGLALIPDALRLMGRAGPGVLGVDLAACDAFRAGAASAAAVACPALVIVGEKDRMSPARAGKALAALIPGASVTTMAGAGHMMMLETPVAVSKAMAAFRR